MRVDQFHPQPHNIQGFASGKDSPLILTPQQFQNLYFEQSRRL